jgi:hypothetical protein
MWIEFKSCNFEELISKKGTPYSAYALRGTKRGYRGAPDEEYVRPIFENTAITIIEKGIARPGMSAVQFLQKAVKVGDLIELKFDRSKTPPELVSIQNKSTDTPVYEPLTEEEAMRLAAQQQEAATHATQAPAPGYAQNEVAPTAATQPPVPGRHSYQQPS